MIVNRPLTPEERHRSQRFFYAFNFGNGMSYMCLGENVLVLFAAQLAAPAAIVSLLGAMQYIGYAMTPLGVRRTARRGAADSQADFWIARNAAALLTASAALVATMPRLSWAVLVLGSLLFYGCRAAGCALMTPLLGDISTVDEAPGVLGKTQAAFVTSAVATLGIVTAVTARSGGVGTLAGVILAGSFLGLATSFCLRGVHETGAMRDAAREPLALGMREAMRDGDLRRLAVAWFLLNLAVMLLIPLSTLALKRGCGFGNAKVLVCACAQLGAGIAISFASGRLCRVFGPRRALVAVAWAALAVPPAWLVFPQSGPTVFPAAIALFLWLGVVYYLFINASGSYFLLSCPDKSKQVAGSVAINLISSAGAGVAASMLGAWLVTVAEKWAPTLQSPLFAGALGPFRLYFLMTFPLIAIALPAALLLRTKVYDYREKHGERALRHAIAMGHHRKN